jgi:tRNA U34 5-methylaminomethyl-2-thiouridine-forming methyltransferase MnmC
MDNYETTIQINRKVKRNLDALKMHPKESYNHLIERLTALAYDEEPLSKEDIRSIRQSLKEIEHSKLRPATNVFKKLEI